MPRTLCVWAHRTEVWAHVVYISKVRHEISFGLEIGDTTGALAFSAAKNDLPKETQGVGILEMDH